MSEPDAWANLRRFTDARIGLGRSGSGLPTREVLAFTMAHAEARDAVLTALDWSAVESDVRGLGFETLRVLSAAEDRSTYLRRPDLGRKLHPSSRKMLTDAPQKVMRKDLSIVVGDGLSSRGVAANIAAFLTALKPHLMRSDVSLAPISLAHHARVALGDEVGELLGVRAVLVLIGERPGLSSPDSLGAYLTWSPRVGLKDADRNCISNIRVRGLSYDEAAFKLGWLLDQAFKRQLTGVNLKDESSTLIDAKPATPALPSP